MFDSGFRRAAGVTEDVTSHTENHARNRFDFVEMIGLPHGKRRPDEHDFKMYAAPLKK
jgi:hypothetical protein